jgi:hypothetical protein
MHEYEYPTKKQQTDEKLTNQISQQNVPYMDRRSCAAASHTFAGNMREGESLPKE